MDLSYKRKLEEDWACVQSRKLHKHGQKGQRDVATSQGMSVVTGNQEKEVRCPFPESPEDQYPDWSLISA